MKKVSSDLANCNPLWNALRAHGCADLIQHVDGDFTGKYKFFMMLVYFKSRHGQVTEFDVEPQETMTEVVMKIE